ncbi:hypothetical protein BV898_08504 [Hypsibius exemplaris]|uniref:G-protein coupled receptors family 1 profile domain-containing protein n=1 Tax=Hypsibius exemplaris TaxID=2072580 RepID=A0A1W0WQB5_HYPEX|nr:hypothetical protein BV898_08504 [Hypsibius exemplaris]
MSSFTDSNASVRNNSTPQHQANNCKTDHDVNGIKWFVFSIICSLIGSRLLILLLITSCHVKRLRSGSDILLLIKLIICGVTFSVILVTIYVGLSGNHLRVSCRAFMLFFMIMLHREYWASLALPINRIFALALPHHHRKLLSTANLNGKGLLSDATGWHLDAVVFQKPP